MRRPACKVEALNANLVGGPVLSAVGMKHHTKTYGTSCVPAPFSDLQPAPMHVLEVVWGCVANSLFKLLFTRECASVNGVMALTFQWCANMALGP